jgi:hypothetical protein
MIHFLSEVEPFKEAISSVEPRFDVFEGPKNPAEEDLEVL